MQTSFKKVQYVVIKARLFETNNDAQYHQPQFNNKVYCVCGGIDSEAQLYASLLNMQTLAQSLSKIDKHETFDEAYAKPFFFEMIRFLKDVTENYKTMVPTCMLLSLQHLVQHSWCAFYVAEKYVYKVEYAPSTAPIKNQKQVMMLDFEMEIARFQVALHKLLDHSFVTAMCVYDLAQLKTCAKINCEPRKQLATITEQTSCEIDQDV